MSDPIADRRQRAYEAMHDEASATGKVANVEVAVETATQVKITADILRSAALGYPIVEEIVKAAFRAAGFEVVE